MSQPHYSDTSICEEYFGIASPPDVHLPTRDELLSLCSLELLRGYVEYPVDSPAFFIKFGSSLYWSEVAAQVKAFHGLRSLGSSVRAPGVYYACQNRSRVIIVMEYIRGKTAGQLLQDCQGDEAETENIRCSIAHCLNELIRIPVPAQARPAAINGAKIRNIVFADQEAPRHYENTSQLEDHMNYFLSKTYKRKIRVEGLTRKPMVFLQRDWSLDNFIITPESSIVAIGFALASVVPSSFAKVMVFTHRFGFDMQNRVTIPVTEGVDNTQALLAAGGRIVTGANFFYKSGLRVAGGDNDTQQPLQDAITKVADMDLSLSI